MRFYVRFSLGILLGVLAGGGTAFFATKWWVVALAATLTAMIVFLATFFIWDADRAPTPAEPAGYEQVLFDKRNLTHLAVFAVLLVGVTYGLNGYGEKQYLANAPDPNAAALDASYDELVLLADAFTAANSALGTDAGLGDMQVHINEAERIRLAVGALNVTKSLDEKKTAIEDAAAFFGAAFGGLRTCASEGVNPCIEARIAQAEAAKALETYVST